MNLRGRSTVCCCETGTTFTGMESNCKIVKSCHIILVFETYTKALEEILCLGINLQSILVLSEVEGRDFGDVLILSLTLFFLELEGDTTDWTTLNAFHQMCGVTGNLIIRIIKMKPRLSIICAHTLLRRRFEAMIAISSQILLLVSKSRVNLG